MVFTSLSFLFFFPIVLFLSFLVRDKYRWFILLLSSYIFYLNLKPIFAVILFSITLTTYIFTNLIESTTIENKRKIFMRINIFLIILPLFFFKYYSEINYAIISFLESYHIRWPLPNIKFLLPVGISFYTFMAIGYTVDVYNGEIKNEKNFGFLALFLSFFPLVLSGPIERAKNLLPQFKSSIKFNYNSLIIGFRLMLWGYFMKLVVADRIGIYVDSVYGNIIQHNGFSLFVATLLYPFQVYADLGGYSLIAIGTSKALGINIIQNFNRPFFATSVSEFWRRWHISLISWLTDYIYIPLSFVFRRYKIWGIVIALMITFLISGIWHGAAFTFILWGVFQGVILSLEAISSKNRFAFEKKYNLNKKAWYIIISIIVTYALFAFSQIFANVHNINDALLVYKLILYDFFHLPYKDGETMLFSFIGISMLFIKEFMEEYYPNKILIFANRRRVIRWGAYYLIIFLILFYGVFGQEKFIYFQF